VALQLEATKLMWHDVSVENYPGLNFRDAVDVLKADPVIAGFVKRIENPGRRADYTNAILALLPRLTNVEIVRGLVWDQIKPLSTNASAKRRKSRPKPRFLSVVVNLSASVARLGDYFDLSELDRFGLHVMAPWADYRPLLGDVPRFVREWEMTADSLDGVQDLLGSIADRAGVRVLHLAATSAADATPTGERKPLSPNPLQLFPELRFLRLRCFDPTSVLSTAHDKLTYLTLGPLACESSQPLEPADRYDSSTEVETDEEAAGEEEEAVGKEADQPGADVGDGHYASKPFKDDDRDDYSSGNDGDAEDDSDCQARASRARRTGTSARQAASQPPNLADKEDEDDAHVRKPRRTYQRRAGIPEDWRRHMAAVATGYGPDAPIRVAAWRVARIHRAAPNQFPSLVGVGFIPCQDGHFSFKSWPRRRLEGIRPMARALQAAKLTMLDEDGERWQDPWFDELEYPGLGQ